MATRALKNVTITLDEKTAAWLRVFAAQRNKSVSCVVGEVLQERMREQRDYYDAMRRFLSRKPFKFDYVAGRLPTREELHDRPGVR